MVAAIGMWPRLEEVFVFVVPGTVKRSLTQAENVTGFVSAESPRDFCTTPVLHQCALIVGSQLFRMCLQGLQNCIT